VVNFSGLYCMQIKCLENAVSEKLCGHVPPAEMTFVCENLTVMFYTDTSVQRNGFKLRFAVNQPSAGL